MLFLLVFGAAFADQSESGFPVLFDADEKNYKDYQLIQGPLIYEDGSEGYSQGFRPLDSIDVSGMFRRQVFDYSSSDSVIGIVRLIKDKLEAQGFNIAFKCHGPSCGDVAGWKLFMGQYVAGSNERQAYLSAYLGDPNQPTAALALYLNEFDNQPRLVADTLYYKGVVSGDASSEFDWLSPLTKALLKNRITDIYFQSSKATVAQGESFANALAKIDQHSLSGKRILIVGSADNRGDHYENIVLSKARADSVKDYLKQNGVSGDALVTVGIGAVNTKPSLARRVSLYLIN